MPVDGRLRGGADVRLLVEQPQDGGPDMVGAEDAVEDAAVGPQFAVTGAGELGAGLDDAHRFPGGGFRGAEQAHEAGFQSAEGLVVVLLGQPALGAASALAGPEALVGGAAIWTDDNRASHNSILSDSVILYTTSATGTEFGNQKSL